MGKNLTCSTVRFNCLRVLYCSNNMHQYLVIIIGRYSMEALEDIDIQHGGANKHGWSVVRGKLVQGNR